MNATVQSVSCAKVSAFSGLSFRQGLGISQLPPGTGYFPLKSSMCAEISPEQVRCLVFYRNPLKSIQRPKPDEASPDAMKHIGILLIRAYQIVLGPFLGGSCRFEPSCSNYGIEAIERFGLVKGAWLAANRIARCHPFGASGFDPVPESWPGWIRRKNKRH